MKNKIQPLRPEQIEKLKANGYYIENMGQEYGEEWKGQYRWMNNNGDFQDSNTSNTNTEAWIECERYTEELEEYLKSEYAKYDRELACV